MPPSTRCFGRAEHPVLTRVPKLLQAKGSQQIFHFKNNYMLKKFILYGLVFIERRLCQIPFDKKPDGKLYLYLQPYRGSRRVCSTSITCRTRVVLSAGEIASDDFIQPMQTGRQQTTTCNKIHIWGDDVFNEYDYNDWKWEPLSMGFYMPIQY